MYKLMYRLLAIAGAGLLASAASAGGAPLATCSTNDISAPGATVIACTGFDSNNLLNSANASQVETILSGLGYSSWDGQYDSSVIKLSPLSGTHTLDFGIQLTGITYLAVHYGGGTGGPGNGTAFYMLDAAQGVSQIHLSYNASSDAVLFVTGLPHHIAAAPEPATWATMIAGFGMVGVQMRRRKRASVTA